VKAPDAGKIRLQAALDNVVERVKGSRYSNDALREAQARSDRAQEEERAAFAAAVGDWRKTSGPLVIEREAAAIPRPPTPPKAPAMSPQEKGRTRAGSFAGKKPAY